MRRIVIYALISIVNVVFLSAQEIIPAGKNGKWGYIDLWGNTAIPFVFDNARSFNGGNRAAVKVSGKWGYINRTGKIVTPCKYDDIRYYADNLVFVKSNNKWGVFDKQLGKTVMVAQFDTIITNYSSRELFAGKIGNKYCAYYNAKEILPLEYDSISIVSGYLVVRENNKFGLVDSLGQTIVPIQFDEIQYRYDGYFSLDNDRFFKPSTGESISYSQYYYRDPYTDGYKVFSLSDCDIYINRNQEDVFQKRFHTARSFSNGIAMITNFDLSRQCIDTLGNVLFEVPNGFYIEPFKKNIAICFEENTRLYGLINRQGEIIVEPQYKGIYSNDKYLEGNNDDSMPYDIYDLSGRLLNYSEIGKSYSGMHFAQRDNKWGTVDSLFNEVIPVVYDRIEVICGRLIARKDDKWGFIDELGNQIIPFIYDDIESFGNGLAVVQYKGKYGIIDLQNRRRTKFEYDKLSYGCPMSFDIAELRDNYLILHMDRVYR